MRDAASERAQRSCRQPPVRRAKVDCMVKLVFTLRRREGMTREEFQRYWREQHAPLVKRHAETLQIRRYVQVHSLETDLDDAIAAPRGSQPRLYDGVAELWWDSLEQLAAAFSSDA